LKHHGFEKPIQAPLEDLPLFKKVSGVKGTSLLAYRELIESGKHGTQVAQILLSNKSDRPLGAR